MTFQQWIALIEAILALLKKQRLAPPRAVRNLTGAVNRSNTMSTATLTWTNPTTRVDGSALAAADIATVEVFDGTTSLGVATSPFTTPALLVGDHSFTVVVTDTAGHKSAPSNSALVTIPATAANPSAVSDLAAVLNP